MRKQRILSLLAVCALTLVSCGGRSTASRAFTYVYGTDPRSFDYLNDSRTTNSMFLVNFIDGLVEHDRFGLLQPCLATSWESNADFSVWTFHIRKGVSWVTSDGEEYAELEAKDWVTALKYGLDKKGRLSYLVNGFIKNAAAYMSGEIADFSQVGVKALDKYTLEYSLEKPTPFFLSMLTYQVYFPLNADFLAAKGDGFGKVDKDGILYNGAYLLANYTAKSVIELDANPSYWDKSNVHVQHVKRVFYDGKDPDSLFNNFDKGAYVSAPIFTDNEALFARAQQKYKDNIFRSRQDSTCYYLAFNYDRQAFSAPNEGGKGQSPKSAKARLDTKKALLNRDFRKALFFGIDRPTMLSQTIGEDNKLNALRNSYTCPELSYDSKGRDYVGLVEDALRQRNGADFGSDFRIDDSQDPYYRPDLARTYMAKAKEGLKGLSFPIELDVVVDASDVKNIKADQSLKASLESLFGADTLKVNLIEMDEQAYLASTYMAEVGSDANFDIGGYAGWGPDYGDPYTFLQTFLPVEGAMLTTIGLDPIDAGTDKAAAEEIGLYEFGKKVAQANAEYKDGDARLALFAAAEAMLLDQAVILPYQSAGGNYAVTRIHPYSRPRCTYGTDDEKYKGMVIFDHVVSTKERDKLKAEWEKAKLKAVGGRS